MCQTNLHVGLHKLICNFFVTLQFHCWSIVTLLDAREVVILGEVDTNAMVKPSCISASHFPGVPIRGSVSPSRGALFYVRNETLDCAFNSLSVSVPAYVFLCVRLCKCCLATDNQQVSGAFAHQSLHAHAAQTLR